jgi:hypothetical protein
MDKAENNVVRECPVESLTSEAMAGQLQRALDMMKRVRDVNAGQTLEEATGNKYVLPEPVVFHVSTSRQ